MKSATFVPLRPTDGVFGLSSAKLPEIFGRPRRDVVKELHFDSTQRLSCKFG